MQKPCAATLVAIGGIWPSVFAAALGSHADAVDAGPAPIDSLQVTKPVQYHLVQRLPNTELLPLAQPTPASHATAIAQLLGQVAPAEAMSGQRRMPTKRSPQLEHS